VFEMECKYVAPALSLREDSAALYEESGVAVFVAALGWILLMYGSAWLWCWLVCRSRGGYSSCSTGWFSAKAVCRY
jgi:hypothetical protein